MARAISGKRRKTQVEFDAFMKDCRTLLDPQTLTLGIDRRTSLGSIVHQLRQGFYDHLGDQITLPERELVEGIIFHLLLVSLYRDRFLKSAKRGRRQIPGPAWRSGYVQIKRLLDDEIKMLGFKKRMPKPLDLQTYLQNKEDEGVEEG